MREIDVMLVVELHDATPYQQDQFRKEMYSRDWVPMADGRALYAAFPGSTTDSGIIRTSEGEVSEAAEDSGIDDWEATCVLA